jgi:hypothetical protein
VYKVNKAQGQKTLPRGRFECGGQLTDLPLISALCLVLLLVAFTPSAIRLYVTGSRTFGQAVSNEVAPVAVGLATVLSAEIGQGGFSLALATLGTTSTSRRLLYASMGMSTSVALAGNIQVALLDHEQSVYAWLEAIVPLLSGGCLMPIFPQD